MMEERTTPILYLVVPCYNEEEALPVTAAKLHEKLIAMIGEGLIRPESRMVFVNDGSKDNTWEVITELHQTDPHVQGSRLSRNGETDQWSEDEGFVGAHKRFMIFEWMPGRLKAVYYI